jgi:hypothetical protein
MKLTELISNGNSITGGFSHSWPAVKFLIVGKDLGMITEKGIERAEGRPSVACQFSRAIYCRNGFVLLPGAERLCDIATKTTNISSHYGNLI